MLWKPPSWYKTRLTVKYTWNWWNALICCVSENPLSKISQEIPHPCVAQNTAKLGCWGQCFMFGPLSLVFASADAVCFSLVFWNMLRNFATKTLRSEDPAPSLKNISALMLYFLSMLVSTSNWVLSAFGNCFVNCAHALFFTAASLAFVSGFRAHLSKADSHWKSCRQHLVVGLAGHLKGCYIYPI